ncbi:group II truncated hemoglobin [Rhizorhabdus dicambivorans]|uniref:Globin n=1 Tax=Rhizorhabdus dicambivorans TaxID=1850238 RepID=A0A2A4FQM3_9SPHN|nr:group II truncated hemoglobin [Rhizorhabdus dicambivorans]ATE63868.1 globin [Rhizorhabdus dicambivorans]PCE40703.1 globin [Rhizorhabdus dicambivorans]
MADPRPVDITPYELLGGAETVKRIVDRFYDLMDEDPAFVRLRAMHADDLTPMRASLTGFLIGWSGGPRSWFEQNPGRCMMSAHAKLAIDEETAAQWRRAMARAIAECSIDETLAERLNEVFARMAGAMVRH